MSNSSEITFSTEQQLALLGHAITTPRVLESMVAIGIPRTLFKATQQKVYGALEDFIKKYHRAPTLEELKSGDLRRDDYKIVESSMKVIEEAISKKALIALPTIYEDVIRWYTGGLVVKDLTELANLWNKKEQNAVVERIHELSNKLNHISRAGLSAHMQTSDKWLEHSIDLQNNIKNKLLYTGITFIDDATCGTRPDDLILITSRTGVGKCLGIGTKVLKYDGSIELVENIKTGDLLMGPDSLPRKVLSTTRGRGELFKIKPTKGDSWICNDVHILTLVDTRDGSVIDIPLNEYVKQSQKFKHCKKLFCVGVDFNQNEVLPIAPYIIGAWIGDGAKSNNKNGLLQMIRFTSVDQEIIDEFKKLSKLYNLNFNSLGIEHFLGRKPGTTKNGENPLLNEFRKLFVDNEIKIPQIYLTASKKDRLELLAGLIDTDGSYSHGCFDFVQKSKEIFDGFVFLARSLGFRVTTRQVKKGCQTGVIGDYWRATVSGDISMVPVRLKRKKPPIRKQKKDWHRTGMKAIPIGIGDYAGFTLDGDGRFLLGDFTVTHNTHSMGNMARHVANSGRRPAYFALEAFPGELESRWRFQCVLQNFHSDPNKPDMGTIDFGMWLNGHLPQLNKYEPSDKQLKDFLKNIQMLYKRTSRYTVHSLIRDMASVESEVEAFFIDHLHYLDRDGKDENAALQEAVQELRNFNLDCSKPIFLAAHVRKQTERKKDRGLLPELEDIHGSSDVIKVATWVFAMSQMTGVDEERVPLTQLSKHEGKPTLMAALKSRIGGSSRTGVAAITYFTRGMYHKDYVLGKLTSYDTEWQPIGEKPPWATHSIAMPGMSNPKALPENGNLKQLPPKSDLN